MAYCAGHAPVGVTHNPSSDAKSGDRGLESTDETPAPGTTQPLPMLSAPPATSRLTGTRWCPARLIMSRRCGARQLHIPFLDINGYYSFLSTTMIVLFVVALVVIFVYEYEALRRSKT